MMWFSIILCFVSTPSKITFWEILLSVVLFPRTGLKQALARILDFIQELGQATKLFFQQGSTIISAFKNIPSGYHMI